MAQIELTFTQIECFCGDRRVRGQRCPGCGKQPDPREVDAETARRRRLAQRALAILDGPAQQAEPLTPLDVLMRVWDELLSWIHHLLDALEQAADSPHHEDALIDAIAEFKSIEARAGSVPRLRPWIVLLRPLDRVVESSSQIARLHLEAFMAAVPLDAQQKAREAQVILDSAGAAAAEVGPLLDRWRRLEEAISVEDALAVLSQEAFEESGVGDILGFDRSGHALYNTITEQEACPVGLGLVLRLAQVQVQTTSDEERFWKVASEAFDILTRHPQRLEKILGSESWVEDLRDVTDKGYGAAVHCQGAIAAARRTRDETRALLTLGLDLVEGRGRHLAATLLSTESRETYESLRRKDTGALLDRCHQQGWDRLFDGLDKTLRAARAHEDYRIEDDHIVVGGRRGPERRMSIDELVDRVITEAESVLALEIAVRCAAGVLEVEIPEPDLVKDLHLPPQDAIQLVVPLVGWSEVEVQVDGDVVRVEARGDTSKGTVVRVIGPVLPYLPTSCATLELTVRSSAETVHCTGPVEPFRRSSESTDELERELRFLEAGHKWTFDGTPVFARDHVRKAFAVLASQALMKPLAEGIRELRSLMTGADRVGDAEARQHMRTYIRQLRSRELQLPPDPNFREAVDATMTWIRQETPELL